MAVGGSSGERWYCEGRSADVKEEWWKARMQRRNDAGRWLDRRGKGGTEGAEETPSCFVLLALKPFYPRVFTWATGGGSLG